MNQDSIKNLNQEFELIASGERFGIKQNGIVILQPEYDFIWCISPTKIGGIRKGDYFGIIDNDGKIVQPISFYARNNKFYTMDEYNHPDFQKILKEKEEFIISNELGELVNEEGISEDIYIMSYYVGLDNIQLDKSGIHIYLHYCPIKVQNRIYIC